MDYLYFQTTVQFRIPIDGNSASKPEIINRWTKPYKGAQHLTRKAAPKPKKQEPRTLKIVAVETGEL